MRRRTLTDWIADGFRDVASMLIAAVGAYRAIRAAVVEPHYRW